MSEYQYYQFLALDRPLTPAQMAEVRRYSQRANITPTSFHNTYNWGSFKGNEDAWLDKYFDLYLYFANWGTRIVKAAIPDGILDEEDVNALLRCGGLISRKGNRMIVTLYWNDESGESWGSVEEEEAEEALAAAVSLRQSLLDTGDRRLLYLSWLAQCGRKKREEEEFEPRVPPGLADDAAVSALARFVNIDQDLLAVAAQASPSLKANADQTREIAAWLKTLPSAEKDAVLGAALAGRTQSLLSLGRRFRADRSPHTSATLRTADELIVDAQTYCLARKKAEEKRAAIWAAAMLQAERLENEKRLAALEGKESLLWAKIDDNLARKQPKYYEQIVAVLLDLHELAHRAGDNSFAEKLATFQRDHHRKNKLLNMIAEAGLQSETR